MDNEMPDFSLTLPTTGMDLIDQFQLDGDHLILSFVAEDVERLINAAAATDSGDACASTVANIDVHMDDELKTAAFDELPPPETPTRPIKKRFHQTTEEEIESLFTERQAKNTKKNTAWGMKVFQDWNIETRGQPMDMGSISKEELATALRQFYTEARPKSNGNSESASDDVYHRNTLINIRGAINRHLSDIHRNIDISRDKEFRYANGVLDGLLKMRAKTGKSKPTNHKPVIEKSDLEKISTYLAKASQNPIILRHNVWYNLSIHFVTRGMEFHHQLKTDSFTFHNNNEYVTLNHSTQQKNYQGGINSDEAPTDKRIYATGTASCPVKMLELLISKSDTAEGPCALFTQYKRNAVESPQTHNTWYTRKPLSKRSFSNFLHDICKSAGVVKNYTPHCLRATAVQFLSDHGHEARHIMYMSAHRNESSLRSYTRTVSTEQKKALSTSLSAITLPSEENVQSASQPESRAVDTHVGHPKESQIALSIPEQNSTSTAHCPLPTHVTFQSNNSMSSHPGFFTNATFNGCTFSFNS